MSEVIFDEPREAGFGDTPWQGVFLQVGQLIDISAFEIAFHDDGTTSATSPTISTWTHMSPFWLTAAIDHCVNAQRFSKATDMAFRTDDAEMKRAALNRELVASVQAITCAAFAIDALHASLLRANPTPPALKKAWRDKRTKRSRQILETLRANFRMDQQTIQQIKLFLDQLSEARDLAAHPPASASPAVKHGRLPVSVEPAFNWFRAFNAMVAVGQAFQLVTGAAKVEKAKHPEVQRLMGLLLPLIQPVDKRWRRTRVGKTFLDLREKSRISHTG